MNSLYRCFNNRFYPEEEAIFGLNRAMKYGDGLFESIRIIDGRPKYLDFHFQRLQKGLSALKIDFSQAKWNEIQTCLTQLVIRNEINRGGSLRLTVYRGGEGKYTPSENGLEYCIEARSLEVNQYQLNAKGLTIEISDFPLPKSRFSNFKTLNSLHYVMASIEREEKRVDELVLLSAAQKVIETTSSNLFLVIGNKVITPPLSEGCLGGVMRRVVISKLSSMEYTIVEGSISLSELEQADEVFLTNASKGIQWVGSYRNKRYFNKVAKQLLPLI